MSFVCLRRTGREVRPRMPLNWEAFGQRVGQRAAIAKSHTLNSLYSLSLTAISVWSPEMNTIH